MLLAEAHEQIVQRLPAPLILVIHARDQLRHHPQPAVQVDRCDVDLVKHQSHVHLRDHAVPKPDAQKVEHVLRCFRFAGGLNSGRQKQHTTIFSGQFRTSNITFIESPKQSENI